MERSKKNDTYGKIEPSSVNHVLWFSQPTPIRQKCARGIRDSLERSLGAEILLDVVLKVVISVDVLVHDHFQR